MKHRSSSVDLKGFRSMASGLFWLSTCLPFLHLALGFQANGNVKLPKLYEYDDFEECRRDDPLFQYCVVRATVEPDESSDVWRNISFLLADTRIFPHDQLERGVCLRSCLQRISSFVQIDMDHLEAPSSIAELSQLREYLGQCVDSELMSTYHLKASVSELHCSTQEDLHQPFGFTEKMFIALVIGLTLLVFEATRRNFKAITSNYDELILPFCLSRNISRLFEAGASGGLSIRYLEGLRAIGMLIIIVVHSGLPMIRMPLKNTEDMEAQTTSIFFPIVNSANTHMITFFFALGGMVLAVSFLDHINRNSQFEWRYLWKKLANRMARLIPAYAFMMFYQATLFKRTKQTPVSYKFVDYCGTNWWSNLLFINNYVHLKEPCMQYGWYLGADFQLFLLGMAIMTIIWRFPRTKMFIVGSMILTSLVTPAYVIYQEKLDATMTFNMRHALTELREYREFLTFYTPVHTNAGTYFFGMIAGFLYHHFSKNNLHAQAEAFSVRMFNVGIVLFLTINGFVAFLPSITQQQRPSLFLALYGAALKAIWGIGHAILFLLFGFKRNSMFVAFLEHPILQVMARLSYAVYIVQYSIIYMIYSNLDVPVTYSVFNSIIFTSAILFLSFLSALLLHLVIEVPCAEIIKKVIDGRISFNKLLSTKSMHKKAF
ncbi:regulator of hypoxia-inducible factor 1-like [Uranotaenia lowii]|uniref:regulator of hypoxia-inducible factor 1-like n=1 Tax=Uranotaenia lowii TaxID=190385 RepID=UPI00247A9FD7|nr:regulator of hypoxia-inducible factor 1-like [Uranotaenia lowii]